MSLEYSRKLIADIAGTREAEDYINGLLKDPEMRADMERAEQQANKWDALSAEKGIIEPEPPEPEREMER